MRLLSKYCTRRVPPCKSRTSSIKPGLFGAGPQNQVRLIVWFATGKSVRAQTPRNAGSANGIGSAAVAKCIPKNKAGTLSRDAPASTRLFIVVTVSFLLALLWRKGIWRLPKLLRQHGSSRHAPGERGNTPAVLAPYRPNLQASCVPHTLVDDEGGR